MKKIISIGISITIFSIAMAFLETSVVIYLRELLYPWGFNFPLAAMPSRLVLTEILREAATIIMLLGAGVLAGKTFSQKFAWFIYSFAIWDIFYYVFLKVLINWPESFFTWDVLFLIPTTWTGPVLSPIIVSITMILLAAEILYFSSTGKKSKIDGVDWTLLILGSIILIIAFTWDYSRYILEHHSLKDMWTATGQEELYSTAMQYIPQKFNWILFISGELVLLAGMVRYFLRKG